MIVTEFEILPNITKHHMRKIFSFNKADLEEIRQRASTLSSEMSSQIKSGHNIEDIWSHFKASLTNIVEENVPSKTRRGRKSLPWFCHRLKRMVKRKARLYKKTKDPRRISTKTQDWDEYKKFQRTCKQAFKKAEEDHVLTSVVQGLEENNPKPFWRYVTSKRQDRTGMPPLKQAGNLVHESKTKAQILVNEFKSVFTKGIHLLPILNNPCRTKINTLHITTNGVEKLLQKIKVSKAAGPDQIPNTVLKECAKELAPGLTDFFQLSIDTGTLPSDWKNAHVTPVFKKGDIHTAGNYRPVSLTSVACKQLEHIVCRHLLQHLQENNILSPLNHGFRAGHSTETQLLTTVHDLFLSHDKKIQSDVIILDFSKAFDTVPHSLLLHKLAHYGIDGPIHRWLTSFLTQMKMSVVIEGEHSNSVEVTSGVPQGTVLGPLLFLCHINDLPSAVKSQVRLFADDCVLYRQIISQRDHLKLQQDLTQLQKWASDWGMRFNVDKCQVMSIDAKTSYFYTINEHILKHTSQNPYLGLTLADDLKWSHHINKTGRKANAILGLLRRNLSFCPEDCKRTAYIALVRSILEYGACVWDPYLKKDIDCLEKTQRRAIRFICGDYTSRNPGSIAKMRKNLNLPTLASRRQTLKLTSFFKVVEGLVPALPISNFLTKARPKRNIKAKKIENFKAEHFVERHVQNHSKCYTVRHSNTEQLKNSYFVQTTLAWNQLPTEVVSSTSPEVFKAKIEQSHLRFD